MGKLVFPTVQISIAELSCPCCNSLPPDFYDSIHWNNFLHHWQHLRDEWGKPIRISKGGGYRCPRYQYGLIMNRKTKACLTPHAFGALDNDFDTAEECLRFADLVELRYLQMRIGVHEYLEKGQTFVHIDECYLVKPRPSHSWIEGFRW